MNKIITLLLLSLNLISYSQSTLEVITKDCRKNGIIDLFVHFELYKNDSLIKFERPILGGKYTIKDLKYGKYKLKYFTLFEKEETTEIELKKNKRYFVELCTNYFDYSKDSYLPYIDKIKNGEDYKINYDSQGCYHKRENSLTILREDDCLFVIFNKRKKKLKKQEIDYIRNFEKELNYMNYKSCTTVDTYIISFKDTKKEIIDGSCKWNGFSYLIEDLNLETN